jgi:hypothetical protein
MLEQWLKTIRAVWPECPARISDDADQLIIRHAEAVQCAEPAAFPNRS